MFDKNLECASTLKIPTYDFQFGESLLLAGRCPLGARSETSAVGAKQTLCKQPNSVAVRPWRLAQLRQVAQHGSSTFVSGSCRLILPRCAQTPSHMLDRQIATMAAIITPPATYGNRSLCMS